MPPSPTRRRIRYRPMTVRFAAAADEVREERASSESSENDLPSGSVCASTAESTPISIMQRGHEPAIGSDSVKRLPHRSHRSGSLAVTPLLLHPLSLAKIFSAS